MDKVEVKLTVFFENPFWVGIFEKNSEGKLSVCRVIFGAEPKDNQVLEYVLSNYHKLQFSPELFCENTLKDKINPKKVQRDVKKQIQNVGIGTKSQQALKLQQEQNKIIRKTRSKEQKEFEKEQKYSLKQQKRKNKHKGR